MSSAAASPPAESRRRLQNVFDDDSIYAKSFDLKQILRLLRWMRPYRAHALSAVAMVLLSATCAVLAPTVISRVFLDDIVLHSSARGFADFGQKALNHWIVAALSLPPLAAACVQFMVWVLLWAAFARGFGVTLGRAILNTL